MQKQLSKQQHQEYNKLKDSQFGAAEEQALTLALEYYLAYKENTPIPPDKIALAFKCAFFMAQKSQYSVNMKGEKVRGIAFSLNKLVKQNKLDDTMFMLKQMTRKIRNIDDQTSTYLSNIVKQISFFLTLHSKFEKTFSQKLQLKQRVSDGGQYTKLFTSYAWLLFILVKNQVLKRSLELLPNTCMIAYIISYMLIFAWDYVKPEGLIKIDKRFTEKTATKQVRTIVKQKILQIFCIKDLSEYKKVATLFQDFMNRMMSMRVLRYNQDKLDFLSPENININYRKLDKYYEQSLNIQHLDERIFFQERALNLTPSKFTPFARQGYVNKHQKPVLGNKLGGPIIKANKQQTFNSHRVLNYEAMQKQIETKNVMVQDIKLPKNIISPSQVKVPLVMATPISTGMQMYNFLNQKKNKIPQNQRTLDKNLPDLIEKVFQTYRTVVDGVNKDNKSGLIISLYKLYYDNYLSANSYEKQSNDLMLAFLGLSLQLVFFVSNMDLSFQKIQQILQIKPFEMWKAIDFFLKSDKNTPFPIKLHFLDLQVNLVSYKIWQSIELVTKMSTFGNKSPKQMTQSQINFMDKLFKRTVHQIAFQISRLTNLLDIDQPNSQSVFQTMKEILVNHPDLLHKRHLDQLIICSIYGSCRVTKKTIKFNDIKQCYASSSPNLKDVIQDIILHVYMDEQTQPGDIIKFYNEKFLSKMKGFINSLKSNNNFMNENYVTQSSMNSKKNSILMSPMKNIIPKQINFKSKNMMGNNPNNRNKNPASMTPQTQLLYAYSQSPILKYEVNALKGPIKAKKIINFEQQVEKTKNNKSYQQQFGMAPSRPTPSQNNIQNYNTANNPSNYHTQQATSDYVNKKYMRKATTPTNQGSTNNTSSNTGIGLTHHMHAQSHQLHIPLQNITKQNMNPPMSSNSHRTLFEDSCSNTGNNGNLMKNNNNNNEYQQAAYKQSNYHIHKNGHQHSQEQQETIKYTTTKNKNYQFGAFRRQL